MNLLRPTINSQKCIVYINIFYATGSNSKVGCEIKVVSELENNKII
jgi:hypothetical protein